MAIAVVGVALGITIPSEGLRHRAYQDPAGIWTVCYGHTGDDIDKTRYYSTKECNEILDKDMTKHWDGLQLCLRAPLGINQGAAVLDFAFNIGVEATCSSTMMRYINAGEYAKAALEFPKWNRATVKGVKIVLPGLTARRTREKTLFLTKDTPASGNPSTGLKTALQGITTQGTYE